ncbi:putative deacetylvindoline O-acetyltransferase [Helianthus anomalus]
MIVLARHESETSLSELVGEIKNRKLQLEGIQSVQQRSYTCSSLCGYPFNKVDFEWGKPMATAIALRSAGQNSFVLMDTADGDGIQAHVSLESQDMEIFQNDKELLSFCQING